MKKLILLTASFFLFSVGIAQPTITNADFFSTGDTARVSLANDPGINFTLTGSNITWDFSHLQAETQRLEKAHDITAAGFILEFQFGPSAPPKYASDYYQEFEGLPVDQLGTVLPVNIENINQIIKIETDSLTNTGYSMTVDGNNVGFRSDTVETAYQFPLTYEDSFASRGYTYIDFNPYFNGIFIQYKQRKSVVDGYGTMITPYGTFNTLRIHHQIEQQDSLYTEISGFGAWLPINRTMHIYEWWTNNEKRPVMRITTEEAMGNETVSEISYRDEYLGLDASLSEENIDVSLYPNPAQKQINIKASSNIQEVSLLSETGKELLSKKGINSTETIVKLENIPSGIYFVFTTTTEGRNISKIIID